MNHALRELFESKVQENNGLQERAFAEILQSIALLGLSRSDFFEKAAFYGGTALRLLHGLDRFSEDLDFSLREPDPDFFLGKYFDYIDTELKSFDIQSEIRTKEKSADDSMESGFIKANTGKHILKITSVPSLAGKIAPEALTKVKIEIDIDPPAGATTVVRYIDEPLPFIVRSYDLPSLFAGKMHAILARAWRNRIKGRDWYDFAFYVRKGISLSLPHLEARLRQTGHYADVQPLTQERFMALLETRLQAIDFNAAKRDVEPFITRPQALDVWSAEYFSHLASRISYDTPAE
ncbi:MAG: nucleotidyl transferase AbiEii/AbiGii toxin family protein [Rectinemataceae bacterium]